MSLETLFGIPTHIEPSEQARLVRVLNRNWHALMSRPVRSLDADLEDLSVLFGAGVSPRSLKKHVYALPDADTESLDLPGEVVVILDGCALITPEGRIMLDVLMGMRGTGSWQIDPGTQLRALYKANQRRAEWQVRWMHKQFHSSISQPVLGAALFLLVNGSVGREHALFMPRDPDYDRDLGAVVIPLVAQFSADLGGNNPAEGTGLRGHWAFSQVSRLMGRDVERDTAKKEGAFLYIRPGREQHLLNDVAERLDKLGSQPRTHQAVLDFVEGYRARRGRLAALGQMHEDPTQTRRIMNTLVAGIGGR